MRRRAAGCASSPTPAPSRRRRRHVHDSLLSLRPPPAPQRLPDHLLRLAQCARMSSAAAGSRGPAPRRGRRVSGDDSSSRCWGETRPPQEQLAVDLGDGCSSAGCERRGQRIVEGDVPAQHPLASRAYSACTWRTKELIFVSLTVWCRKEGVVQASPHHHAASRTEAGNARGTTAGCATGPVTATQRMAPSTKARRRRSSPPTALRSRRGDRARAADAVAAARRLGFPVAVKAAGPHIIHKTERRLVALGLQDEAAVAAAAVAILERCGDESASLLVERMSGERASSSPHEARPGVRPVVIFGVGDPHRGSRRLLARVTPLERRDIERMLGGIRRPGCWATIGACPGRPRGADGDDHSLARIARITPRSSRSTSISDRRGATPVRPMRSCRRCSPAAGLRRRHPGRGGARTSGEAADAAFRRRRRRSDDPAKWGDPCSATLSTAASPARSTR